MANRRVVRPGDGDASIIELEAVHGRKSRRARSRSERAGLPYPTAIVFLSTPIRLTSTSTTSPGFM
jgi:hypothetical protein